MKDILEGANIDKNLLTPPPSKKKKIESRKLSFG